MIHASFKWRRGRDQTLTILVPSLQSPSSDIPSVHSTPLEPRRRLPPSINTDIHNRSSTHQSSASISSHMNADRHKLRRTPAQANLRSAALTIMKQYHRNCMVEILRPHPGPYSMTTRNLSSITHIIASSDV
jgi:hypothetical protein